MEAAAVGPPMLVAAERLCKLIGERSECPCGAKVIAEAIDVAKVISSAAHVKESMDQPLLKGEICDTLRGIAFVRTGRTAVGGGRAVCLFAVELVPRRARSAYAHCIQCMAVRTDGVAPRSPRQTGNP
eukprot:1063332-Prymnesium_polylepis.2